MKIKKTIILIFVLIIVLLAALYFSKTPVQSPIVEDENNQIVGDIYTYTNSDDGQQLKVSYDNTNNTAIIYPDGVNKIVFNATTTGSGARYANDEQGLILWNKGDDVSLYLNDSLIFTGTTYVIDTENVGTITNTPSTNSKGDVTDIKKDNIALTKNTWVWKETILSTGQKITPKQAGKFTITFNNGKVSGTTDCNSFGGSYESTNSSLKFGPMMSTEMACMNSQETEYNQMINKISTYSIDKNGNLVCKMTDSGSIIFEKK
jgi:heat shock protein HslJ/membrane-bound inhibitor of C-type lysozyme